MTIGREKTKQFYERRVDPRHPMALDVNYRHGDTYLFCRSDNLSEFGIFLVSPEPLVIGTQLELRFLLPEGGDIIEISGVVVWIEPGGNGRRPGMGVKFIDPSTAIRARLKTLIRTMAYLE